MLRYLGGGLLSLVAGYLIGLFGGMWIVEILSTNRHDRAMEAAMTGAFVIGPLCALVAFFATIGFLASRRK